SASGRRAGARDSERWRSTETAQYVTVPPGVGKTHLAIALGRAVVEAGHTVLFTTATALLADLVDGQSKGILASRMFFYGKPKLLVVDELGYMPARTPECSSLLSAREPSRRESVD